MTRAYDVLVVGARVGGGSLALLLARQGRRVLMARPAEVAHLRGTPAPEPAPV